MSEPSTRSMAGDAQLPSHHYPFTFTGSGTEYFKIWIVNVLFSILTLGIYSAWAKVRRLQYFYRNTQLAGASFDYHGEPRAILKGRAVAFLLLVIYGAVGKLNPLLGVAVFLLLSVATPFLLVRSFQFNWANTSYRGLRFAFTGDQKGAARVFLLYPMLTILSLGLALPWVNHRARAYVVAHSRYGSRDFRFKATAADYYRCYLWVVLPLILGLVGVWQVARFWSKGDFLFMLGFAYFAAVGAAILFALGTVYLRIKLFNLAWNGTRLHQHRFYCRMDAGSYLWLKISNGLAILLTLGLFIPFAAVRSARYRLAHMGMKTRGDLGAFVAGELEKTGAMGEEVADVMDLDLAL